MFIDYDLLRGGRLSITKHKIDEAQTPEDNLEIAQLSSGERTLIHMLTDLAISLIDKNPEYAEGSSPLKEGFGIVLIDEIDLHLHPSWQRRLTPQA